MPKKKRVSFVQRLGETVSDMANAASVAATGSEMGVLELAAEDELRPAASKRARKAKAVRKKQVKSKKSGRPVKMKRTVKRR
jgi:hypothetical protein